MFMDCLQAAKLLLGSYASAYEWDGAHVRWHLTLTTQSHFSVHACSSSSGGTAEESAKKATVDGLLWCRYETWTLQEVLGE